MKVNLLDFDLQGLVAHSATMGERAFRAEQLMRWIHQAGESDFGADRVYALQLPPGAQGSDFARAAARVLYPIGVLSSAVPELSGGADIGPLAEVGVPVFGLSQDGTRYFDLHHTADDTLDKIDPAQLSQNVAAWAGLVWLIADSEVDFRALRAAAAPAAR